MFLGYESPWKVSRQEDKRERERERERESVRLLIYDSRVEIERGDELQSKKNERC